MGKTATVVMVTLLVGVPAFLLAPAAPLGPLIWPPPVDLSPAPTAGQVTLFQILGAFEALSLGLGVSFLFVGWSAVRRIAGPSQWRAVIMYVGVAWFLVNWWVHDGLHIVAGMSPRALLGIEYGFHVTLIFFGAGLAYCIATARWDERV